MDNNLTRLIDPVGNATQFVYDARNRQVAEVDPLGNRIEYSFDAADNLIAKTDRNGRVTRFTYDDVDRLVGETWLNANTTIANTITYAYDKASNLLTLVDDFSSLAWTYDARDRAISESNAGTPGVPEVQQTYSYDALGNLVSTNDAIGGSAGATTNYLYDVLNRMTQITQTGSGGLSVADKRVDIAYNPIGQFSSIDRYSDLAGTQLIVGTSYQFDSINRLTNIAHNNSSSTVAFYDFTYDADSRITSITDVDGISNYNYDNRDQLIGADHADASNPDENYTYDANGNRVDSHLHGNGYVTGPANRLLSDGTYNYGYDAEGNRILQTEISTGNYREFTYDHRNRLILVVDFDSNDVEQQGVAFSYDVLGRRISKTVDSTATIYFVYQGQDVILDFVDTDGPGGIAPILSQRFLHGPAVDQVFAQEDAAGNVEWLLTDHLGTTRDIVDNFGQIINHIRYDSYGSVIDQSNPSESTRYLFTGRELDEEFKLIYYRTRYYDTALGQFITEDSIRFNDGSNLQIYVHNSPIAFFDPYGTQSTDSYNNASGDFSGGLMSASTVVGGYVFAATEGAGLVGGVLVAGTVGAGLGVAGGIGFGGYLANKYVLFPGQDYIEGRFFHGKVDIHYFFDTSHLTKDEIEELTDILEHRGDCPIREALEKLDKKIRKRHAKNRGEAYQNAGRGNGMLNNLLREQASNLPTSGLVRRRN